jgi:hypothetical protein
MPGSCSSSSLNGCAACAPGLALFSVGHSANFPAPGCPTYLNSTLNGSANGNVVEKYPEVGLVVTANASSSTNTSTVVVIKENEDGSTTTTTTIQGNSRGKGLIKSPGIFSTDRTSIQSGLTITKTDSCGNTTIITDEYNASTTVITDTGSGPSTVVTEGLFVDYVGSACIEGGEYTIVTCNSTSDCEGEKMTSTASTSYGDGAGYNTNGQGSKSFIQTYSNEAPSNEPEPIVNKQISKLKTNNFGAACKCGEGRKDDCWGAFGSFTFADPTVTISKAALKIGVIKEGFNKKYQSVGGTVKFYIPSEQDIEEGRTPCCNDDFSGTVVTSKGFSLGGSSFKEGAYLATDIGQLSTGPIGQTVVACIEITSVSFI